MWVVYLLFLIILPINAIIKFIQTGSRTRDAHKHKRQDLLDEPITAEHYQSHPIHLRWRHCLLSRDFLPFILNYPPPKSQNALGGVLKLNGLRGGEREADCNFTW